MFWDCYIFVLSVLGIFLVIKLLKWSSLFEPKPAPYRSKSLKLPNLVFFSIWIFRSRSGSIQHQQEHQTTSLLSFMMQILFKNHKKRVILVMASSFWCQHQIGHIFWCKLRGNPDKNVTESSEGALSSVFEYTSSRFLHQKIWPMWFWCQNDGANTKNKKKSGVRNPNSTFLR